MSDLEDRLTEALRRGADDAPYPVDLATGARRRARLRRRHRVAAAGVGLALVAGVPAGVLLARGADVAGPDPAATATPASSSSVSAQARFVVGGCPSTLRAARATRPGGQGGFVVVCSYAADGLLLGSRGLDLVDSTTVRADVQNALPATGPGCPAEPSGALILLLAPDLDATVDLEGGCLYVGAGHEQRVLPAAVRDISRRPVG